ncbi:MAG: hypothetical protein EA388_15645 [Nitriliruptor sp.]|nr:MAG: hypothetical protein EA388_15645 [Nitriliruptor sp.]
MLSWIGSLGVPHEVVTVFGWGRAWKQVGVGVARLAGRSRCPAAMMLSPEVDEDGRGVRNASCSACVL